MRIYKTFCDVLEESRLKKFNPYHDKRGRFSSADGASFVTITTRDRKKQHLADSSVDRMKEQYAVQNKTKKENKARKTNTLSDEYDHWKDSERDLSTAPNLKSMLLGEIRPDARIRVYSGDLFYGGNCSVLFEGMAKDCTTKVAKDNSVVMAYIDGTDGLNLNISVESDKKKAIKRSCGYAIGHGTTACALNAYGDNAGKTTTDLVKTFFRDGRVSYADNKGNIRCNSISEAKKEGIDDNLARATEYREGTGFVVWE